MTLIFREQIEMLVAFLILLEQKDVKSLKFLHLVFDFFFLIKNGESKTVAIFFLEVIG